MHGQQNIKICKRIILALKLEGIIQCLQFHQQKFDVQQTTRLLDVPNVWEPQELISLDCYKYGQ